MAWLEEEDEDFDDDNDCVAWSSLFSSDDDHCGEGDDDDDDSDLTVTSLLNCRFSPVYTPLLVHTVGLKCEQQKSVFAE